MAHRGLVRGMITMADTNETVKAVASAITEEKKFTVTWQHV